MSKAKKAPEVIEQNTDTQNTNAQNPQSNSQKNARRGGRSHGPGGGMPLGRAPEKAKDVKGTLRKLIRFLRPNRVEMIFIMIFAVLVAVPTVIAPNFLRYIFNDIQNYMTQQMTQSAAFSDIDRNFIIIAILYSSRFVVEWISYFLGNKVSNLIGKRLRTDMRHKLEKLPIKYYDSRQTGDILSSFSNDVDVVVNSIQQSLITMITSFFVIIGILVMMFTISWKMTIIALLALPLYIVATRAIAKRSQSKFIKRQKGLGAVNGFIEEYFTASMIVKLYGKQEESYQDFQKINAQLAEDMKSATYLSGLIRPLMQFLSNVAYVAIVLFGAWLAGGIPPLMIGDITIFIMYQRNFVNPILSIANIINQLQSTIAGAERIFKILDETEEVQEQDNKEFSGTEFKGNVEFKDIDFSYSKDKELIKDLNLEVYPGRQIAIVGPTGAGKTTLVNLLMRFYEVDKGHILVEGIDSTDVKRESLRKQFGMVLQDTWLFSGSIRDNIAYGRPDATDEEIIAACKQAHVHHFIETLPQGYDTVLKEDASNISKGQKQLLTIARAILSNPKILILDEATSSVDTRTESYIQNAMDYMMQGKTSFVIAHRLSTIKNAHLILVMDHGRIVEQGNHKELLAKNGVYADLYNSQFLNQPT